MWQPPCTGARPQVPSLFLGICVKTTQCGHLGQMALGAEWRRGPFCQTMGAQGWALSDLCSGPPDAGTGTPLS